MKPKRLAIYYFAMQEITSIFSTSYDSKSFFLFRHKLVSRTVLYGVHYMLQMVDFSFAYGVGRRALEA